MRGQQSLIKLQYQSIFQFILLEQLSQIKQNKSMKNAQGLIDQYFLCITKKQTRYKFEMHNSFKIYSKQGICRFILNFSFTHSCNDIDCLQFLSFVSKQTMQQNQLRNSEIPLEPWSHEESSVNFLNVERNIKSPNPQKKSPRKHSPTKNSNTNKRQIRYLKQHFNPHQIQNLTKQICDKDSFNKLSAMVTDSTPNKYMSIWDPKRINSMKGKLNYQYERHLGKIPVNTTYIGYIDTHETPVRNNKSADKGKNYSRNKSSTLQTPRPATTASFYVQKKSHPTMEHSKNKSALYERQSNDYKFQFQNTRENLSSLANYTLQYQKMLKLKQNLRQRKKIYSHRRDQERQNNLLEKRQEILMGNDHKAIEIKEALETNLKNPIEYSIKQSGRTMEKMYEASKSICHERRDYLCPQQKSLRNRGSAGLKVTKKKPISVTNFLY